MKKQFLSIILAAAVLASAGFMLAACADDDVADAGTTEETEATAVNDSTEAPETLSSVSVDETQSETVETKAQTVNTWTDGALSLNMDLIADYGLNFDELKAKYGKVTRYYGPEGGTAYGFERGYGDYICGDISRIVDWVEDETLIGGKYAVIEGDTTCYSVLNLSVSDLFKGDFSTLTVEDIASIPGITYERTTMSDVYDPGMYYSGFKYDGFWHEHGTTISIRHEKENEITSSSELDIFTWAAYDTESETVGTTAQTVQQN